MSKFFDNVDVDKGAVNPFLGVPHPRQASDQTDTEVAECRGHSWRRATQFTEKATPQGAVIVPVLANIYLHSVLDQWFDHWRRNHAQGELYIVRYADDFVISTQYEQDARRLLAELKRRFSIFFSDSAHPDKTRLIEFGRFASSGRRSRKQGKPETFDFLGFTHFCSKTRWGKFAVRRKPVAKRMARKLRDIKETLKGKRKDSIKKQGRWLRARGPGTGILRYLVVMPTLNFFGNDY